MAKQPARDFGGSLIFGVACGIGLASLIDLVGRATYRNMQAAMPEPRPWTIAEVFESATNGLVDARARAERKPVDA